MPLFKKIGSHFYKKSILYSIVFFILFAPVALVVYIIDINEEAWELKKAFARALEQERVKDVPEPILIAEIIKYEWDAICILTAYSDRLRGTHPAVEAANHALDANKFTIAGEGEFVTILLIGNNKSKILSNYGSAEVNNPGGTASLAPRDLLERFKISPCAFRNNAYAIPYKNWAGKLNFYLSQVE